MQQSKYVRILQKLQANEIKAFHKYLTALYGGKTRLLETHNYVFQYANVGFKHHKLEKKYVHQKLYTTAKAKKDVGDDLSDLTGYLEEFLRWQKINKAAKTEDKIRMRLEIYKERGLEKDFRAAFEKREQQIRTAPLDMWQHLRLAELYSDFYYSSFSKKFSKKEILLKDIRHEIVQFYQNSTIKIACELRQREDIFAEKNQVKVFQAIDGDDFYRAYQLLWALINQQTDATFEKVKDFVLGNLEKFCKDDQAILVTHLFNYCQKNIKEGDLSFGRPYYALFKMAVKTELVYENGLIGHMNYGNIVEMACKYGDLEWAEDFIEKNKHKILPKKIAEPTYKIALGILDLAKGNYSKLISDLNDVSHADLDHGNRLRWLLLAAHLELHPNSKVFTDYCAAFEVYFRRNKVLHPDTIRGSLNYLKFARKLSRPYQKEKLFQQILTTAPIYYKYWMLKKIDPTFES